MAGLIEAGSSTPVPFKMPDFGGTTGYTPQVLNLDSEKDTVSGQLDSILKSGSPFLERARAGAADTANRRGLLNSSMAAGAGEAAAIDAALPIAQANAQANQAFKSANQTAFNQAAQHGSSAANDAFLQKSLQQLRGDQATQLANIEAAYKTQIQASDASAKLYQQTVDAINKTLTSADLSPEAKDNAVARQVELLQTGLGVIGKIGDLDLTSLLNFSPVTGNATPANAVISAPSQPGAAPGTYTQPGESGGDGE